MKKLSFLTLAVVLAFPALAQITVTNGVVPSHMQGVNGTNNSRTHMWCWLEISGLTPGATYRYYSTVDTLNASTTSNGAGNPILMNMTSGTVRRTTNASLVNNAGHDSLTATNAGTFAGWFGVEPTGNARFTPGFTVYPKIILNNGAGGTTVATRLVATQFPITVINYGTASGSPVEGTALYDSVGAAAKNFIGIYDNVAATGRPVAISIVENDGLDLYPVTSIATFYRNMVDTMAGRWGAIIPNALSNGVRALVEYDRATAGGIDTIADADGWWCSGLNTVNMSAGTIGLFLNSSFVLAPTAIIPDTMYVNIQGNFSASSNDPSAYYVWDFGDSSLTVSGANVTHTYANQGLYPLTLVITNGACSDTITQNIVVMLGTGIQATPSFLMYTSPNPTDGQFIIAVSNDHLKTIEVMNLLGEIVYSGVSNTARTNIDIAGQPKGMYLVRVTDRETNRVATRKIVLK